MNFSFVIERSSEGAKVRAEAVRLSVCDVGKRAISPNTAFYDWRGEGRWGGGAVGRWGGGIVASSFSFVKYIFELFPPPLSPLCPNVPNAPNAPNAPHSLR